MNVIYTEIQNINMLANKKPTSIVDKIIITYALPIYQLQNYLMWTDVTSNAAIHVTNSISFTPYSEYKAFVLQI